MVQRVCAERAAAAKVPEAAFNLGHLYLEVIAVRLDLADDGCVADADLVFVALAVASIGYWMNQYVPYAINRVSDPNQWDLTMGAIAIVVVRPGIDPTKMPRNRPSPIQTNVSNRSSSSKLAR